MLGLEIDFAEAEKFATSIGAAADQIPFALATALNGSADVTRNLLIRQTWPGHIHQRNSSFIAASLTTKESRATKGSLSVEIYDRLNRGNLMLHAQGGTRKPVRGPNLAVPASDVPRGPRGVPERMRPKNLKDAFKIKDALYTRDRKGKLKLVYILKRTTKVPKRVPFFEDYAASMSRELHRTIPLAVEHAMATRRR